jgi:ParB family chromosome partitioning protein
MALDKRLGRGLGSLLGGPDSAGIASVTPRIEGQRLEVPLIEIRPNPHQPREVFDSAGLEELRDSIRNHGVLQAVILRRIENGYELIAGERRCRASRLAGKVTIPAVIREGVSDEEMLELALVENVQRRDLDALEKARGYQQMMKRLELTQEQVARKVGLQRSTVANHVRLLDLDSEAQAALSAGLISMGHARALLGLEDPERVRSALDAIVRDGLSVRDTEDRVRGGRAAPKAAPQSKGRGMAKAESGGETGAPQEPWAIDLQRRMQIHMGARVQLQSREGYQGRIVIEFHGREELDRLIELLAPREPL